MTRAGMDLAELRRLAEAALSSEDELRDDWWPAMVDSLNIEDEADAAYIAVANPVTILALLDLLDSLRETAQAVIDEWDELGPTGTFDTITAHAKLRDALASSPDPEGPSE